nr:YbaK/EbsC family protein [Turicimonas muris]
MKDSTATVDLAAQALGYEPARIAKTLSFDVREKTVMLVCAGTAKVDNKKFKETFQPKQKCLELKRWPTGRVFLSAECVLLLNKMTVWKYIWTIL